MKDLDFYFDFSSPFAYLGAMSIQDVARRAGARLVWRPMFLGGLFKAIGTPTVPLMTLSPAKQRYVQIDLQRWADYRGLPLKWPSRFPMMTITPLRMTVALLDQGHDPWPLIERVFKAYWAEDQDISDRALLGTFAAEIGHLADLVPSGFTLSVEGGRNTL